VRRNFRHTLLFGLLGMLLVAGMAAADGAAEGDKLFAKGKMKAALAAYDKALQKDPSDDNLRKQYFYALIEDHKWREAGGLLESAPKSFAHRSYYDTLRGLYLLHKGDFEEAAAALEAGVKKSPSPQGLFGLTSVYSILLKKDAARETALRLAKEYPEHPRSQLALASVLQDQKDYAKAAVAFATFIKRYPFDDSIEERSIVGRDVVLKEMAKPHRSPYKTRFEKEAESIEMKMLPLAMLPSIRATINGQETTLLFDSGASENVVFEDFAAKAGIKAITKGSAFGIGGEGTRGAGLADVFAFGSVEVKDVPVSIIPKAGQLAMLGKDLGGIFSPQSFEELVFALDYPAKKLHIMRAKDYKETLRLMGQKTGELKDERIYRTVLPFYSVANLFVVRPLVNGKPALGLFDTGAPALVMDERQIGYSVEEKDVAKTGFPLSGVGEDARTGRMVSGSAQLRLGDASVRPLMTLITDLSILQQTGTDLQLVVGGTMFVSYRVIFDTVNGRIILEKKLEN
jgi:tetratricopeptide (TPR) repeat protein